MKKGFKQYGVIILLEINVNKLLLYIYIDA